MQSVLPKAVRELTQELTRLPGVGPKTAKRLAIYLLRQPYSSVSRLAGALKDLHANVRICRTCFSLAEAEECLICKDSARDRSVVCVVEEALDVEAFERTDVYTGVYHILGGVLSPLEGVTHDQLNFKQLFARLENEAIKELIIGLDHNMESEVTARYILENVSKDNLKVTRLARGLPTGGDIEFADSLTLSAAFQGRSRL